MNELLVDLHQSSRRESITQKRRKVYKKVLGAAHINLSICSLFCRRSLHSALYFDHRD